MATEAQILANRRNAQKSTAPRTNRLSSPACQRIMTSIMQNKPNLLDTQMNVTSFLTKYYENVPLRRCGENKPNQTQFQRQKYAPPGKNLNPRCGFKKIKPAGVVSHKNGGIKKMINEYKAVKLHNPYDWAIQDLNL